MSKTSEYRDRAEKFEQLAAGSDDPAVRSRYTTLAQTYRDLATHLERMNEIRDAVA